MRPGAILERANRPGPLRLVFLGNIIPRKGLHTLLAALSRLPAQSVSLEVVGCMTSNAGYASQIRKHVDGLAQNVSIKFHGYLDDENLRKILEQAHLLVVPSSYEGFGIVYSEGMAFGLPAIGTTGGGASEVIRNGENGYLIQTGDVAELAEHLNSLQRDRKLLGRLSLNARATHSGMTAWEQSAQDIRAFLSRMVGAHE